MNALQERDPLRVLVVEDNEDHRYFILRALDEVAGMRLDVEAVGDGEQALAFIHRRGDYAGRPRPHFVLLDLKMPRLNGFEVLENLKGDPELRTIPVSVLTSSDRPEDVAAAYRLGTNSYIQKPSDPARLRAQLTAVSEYWTARAVLPLPPP